MAKRLFIGGLSWNVTSAQLEEAFAKFGKVTSCDVIIDKFTNKSKGFGFVTMDVDEEADKAIEALNDTELDGRKIVVNIAKPREESSGYDNRSSGSYNDRKGPRRDYGNQRNNNRNRY